MEKHLVFPSAVLLTGTLGREIGIEIRRSSETVTGSIIRMSNLQTPSSLPAICGSTGRSQSDKPMCDTRISEAIRNAQTGIYSGVVLTPAAAPSAAPQSGKEASVSAR